MKNYRGSDDGYDYSRDNRDGSVDVFLKSFEQPIVLPTYYPSWHPKSQEKEKEKAKE